MAKRDDDDGNDPLLGRVLDGRFTLQSVLGRGGMGVVYRAHQASLERSVALKVMMGVDAEREVEFQRRFFLEAATVAKLKHPNTITVFDYGSTVIDGGGVHAMRVFFIAMELLEGMTLSKLVSHGRALPPLRALHIGVQICRSLREAHKAGVVHRDLKPGNVMIVRSDDGDDVEGDFVKVLDFGLAKVSPTATSPGSSAAVPPGMTKAGTFMGSPRYVAPEQVEGRAVDARADIYSFGCLMFRVLSGKVPFDGASPVEIMLKQVKDAPPLLAVPELPRTLVDLVMQCLRKDPAERPASMDEVLVRLKLARAELGGVASGLTVLSDERVSVPDAAAVDELPPPTAPGERTELASTRLERVRPDGVPATNDPPPSSQPGWSLGSLPHASRLDDSTRPTRVFGQITALRRAPRRPWLAAASGAALALVGLGIVGAWRLGLLPERLWVEPAKEPAATPQVQAVPAGPLAHSARLRITTTPPGADVLEERDGLPRLLGVTPLTVPWDVDREPRARHIVLRKEGYVRATARVMPPPAAAQEPVWLDVDATLRPDVAR